MKKKSSRARVAPFRPLTRDSTKVCFGGEWDFPPRMARNLEDLWSVNFHVGTDFVGFRLVRSAEE